MARGNREKLGRKAGSRQGEGVCVAGQTPTPEHTNMAETAHSLEVPGEESSGIAWGVDPPLG